VAVNPLPTTYVANFSYVAEGHVWYFVGRDITSFFLRLESLKGKVGFRGWNVQSLWGKSKNLRFKLRATNGGKWRATNGERGGRRRQNVVFLCLWV